MAADITKHFRATVKALRLSCSNSGDASDAPPRPPPDTAFHELSHRVRQSLTRAADLVRSAHDSFLRISAERGGWSEQDRERLEAEAEALLRTCRQGVSQLAGDSMLSDSLPEQVRQHRRAVVDSLKNRLSAAQRLLGEQMEVRSRRAAFQQRLASGVAKQQLKATKLGGRERRSDEAGKPERLLDSLRPSLQDEEEEGLRRRGQGDVVWAQEEEQMLSEENEVLLKEVTDRLHDVRGLQTRVTEIARLQNVFAENVASQASDIERIAGESVASTENVREGNEQLRDAMKNRASYRFWLLFCLIVLTLSLLFLDWYNP